MTIDELIESYDYDYYDGTINVTAFSDSMADGDSDGTNDTLFINLTTDATSNTQYYFIVELIDDGGLVANYSNTSVNSSSPNVSVAFPTTLLNKDQYNYTVRIRDSSFGLAYEKYKTETAVYSSYETGNVITNVSDSDVGSISITINLNITQNTTENITVHLTYGENETISETLEDSLTTPTDTVEVLIANETVKSTHHNGTYTVETIEVGPKVFDTSHTTSSYNYEDFADSSYIQNVTLAEIENTSNNLTDALEINVTIEAESAVDHTVTISFHDPEQDLVSTKNTTESLSAGSNTVTLTIAGEDVYKTYESGTFTLSTVNINSTAGNDTRTNVIEADLTYTDFESPERPDLIVDLDVSLSITTLTATVNVTNNGTMPAHNVILDIFDDNTYENQSVTTTLDANQSTTETFTITGVTNDTIITSIVDFDNVVDEDNETNNIASNTGTIITLELQDLKPNSATRVIEAAIENQGTLASNNFTWGADTGDGTFIESDEFGIIAGGGRIVLIEHAYAIGDTYTFTFNTTNSSTTFEENLTIDTNFLKVKDAEVLHEEDYTRVIIATLANTGDISLDGVNWTFITTGTTEESDSTASLSELENLTLIIEHTYAALGDHTVNITTQNASLRDEWVSTVTVAELSVASLAKLTSTDTLAVFTFDVSNEFTTNITADWTFETDDSVNITSDETFTLEDDENLTVLVEYNYSSTGTYNVTASANTTETYSESLEVTI